MMPMDGEFLNAYSGQTTAQLLGMATQYRVDSLVLAFEQGLEAKMAPPRSTHLTGAERTILAVEALEREVNNGGYSLFFTNSSKEYATEIVNALERIGCRTTASITARAIQALRIQGPLTIEAVDEVMTQDDSDRDEALNECDSKYYGSGEAIAD